MLVTGRVQGVSFRAYTKSEARRLALVGWVRNLADGRVEGAIEAVDEMVLWCHHGSPAARVDRAEAHDEPSMGLRGFHIYGLSLAPAHPFPGPKTHEDRP